MSLLRVRSQCCICQISTRVGWVQGPKGPEPRRREQGMVLRGGQRALPCQLGGTGAVSSPCEVRGGATKKIEFSVGPYFGTWKSHQDSVQWWFLHKFFAHIGSKGFQSTPEHFRRYDWRGLATSWRGVEAPPPKPPTDRALCIVQ